MVWAQNVCGQLWFKVTIVTVFNDPFLKYKLITTGNEFILTDNEW